MKNDVYACKPQCFPYVCSICACLILSVSSSSWCLGRAAACGCGTPWTFLLPFLHHPYTLLIYGYLNGGSRIKLYVNVPFDLHKIIQHFLQYNISSETKVNADAQVDLSPHWVHVT